jgi:hypothetical protein
MSLSELLPVVRDLPHQEKLRLLQFLANSLAHDEGLPDIRPGAEFPVWSPYEAFPAAVTMQHALDTSDDAP